VVRKTFALQNRSLCDDLGRKWPTGLETLRISLLFQQKKKKIHYTFLTSAPVPNRGVLELEATLQQQIINNK
jgi:hypothetical protein